MTQLPTASAAAIGAPVIATPQPIPALAPTAAPKPASAPAATTAPTKPKIKVGLVTDLGRIDDKGFNQTAWEGVQQAQKELDADVSYIETIDPRDYNKNIEQFADKGYKVIVTVGFALGEATYESAKKYPNIKFIGVDQLQTEPLPNLAGLIFDEDKAGYLAGALAASVSKSGSVGAVCGTDTVPPVWRYGEGYRAGALSVKPDINVQIVYHNDVGFDKTFSDPEWGKTTANAMIDKGADVIFGCGGTTGNGALLAAADKGVYAIGVDTDQYLTLTEAQKVMLSSAMKLETLGVFNLIKAIQDGSFKGGNNVGPVGLAPFHDLDSQVPADVRARIEEIRRQLLNGSLNTNVPPTKPQA